MSYVTWPPLNDDLATAVHLVLIPFSQFIPQLELYSQLDPSFCNDPIACCVPKSTKWVLVKIQSTGSQAKPKWRSGESLSIFWDLEPSEKWHCKLSIIISDKI